MLSIIIPVYNVEKYIRRCVESILSQSYNDIQIILIDDGSTDSSGIICDEYAEKDHRIAVIHQKNQGQSVARNVGLNYASGEYITFVDSDDGVVEGAYTNAMKLIQKHDADVVVFGYKKVYEDTMLMSVEISKNLEYICYSSEEAFVNIDKVTLQVWNKIYKTKNLEGIRFKEGILYEDILFTQSIINNSKNIIYADFAGYYYTVAREGSTVSSFKKNRIDGLKEMYNLCMYLGKKDNFDKYEKVYLQAEGFYCANYFDAIESKVDPNIIKDIYSYFCAIYDVHKGKKRGYTYLFRFFPRLTYLLRKVGRKIKC